MCKRLERKVAIVTGAGSVGQGIGNGKATAILFAREGASVMLVDNNFEAAEETENLINQEGGNCTAFKADVSKSSDCKNMADSCIETYGRIDILHNNVGIGGYGDPIETSEEEWDHIMTVNLKSMFLTCKHVLPYMLKQRYGSIINISSINAITITVPAVAYSTSKAGVIAFTREVAYKYADKGIRVNAILPGLIKTPMVAEYGKDAYGGDIKKMWQKRDAMSPTGKQGESFDIAQAALFLASDESKYISGTHLIVDGSITATMLGTVKPE